jgi:hypothetical protein
MGLFLLSLQLVSRLSIRMRVYIIVCVYVDVCFLWLSKSTTTTGEDCWTKFTWNELVKVG